jgi:hypothetical protein
MCFLWHLPLSFLGRILKLTPTTPAGRWQVKHGALFVLTCLVATAVGWAQGLPKASDPQDGIPFEVNPKFGSILIKAQVNGRPAKLVVDTGSSHTILS